MRQTADAEDHLKIPYVQDDDDNIYMLKNRLSRAHIYCGKDWPRGTKERAPACIKNRPRDLAHGFSAGRPLRPAKISLWGSDTV
jgi:hypothetical protein